MAFYTTIGKFSFDLCCGLTSNAVFVRKPGVISCGSSLVFATPHLLTRQRDRLRERVGPRFAGCGQIVGARSRATNEDACDLEKPVFLDLQDPAVEPGRWSSLRRHAVLHTMPCSIAGRGNVVKPISG